MMETKTRIQKKATKPNPSILADNIQRIVEAAQPERIILFGSAARGEMGPNSDLDVLVIKAGKFDYWGLLTRIYTHLSGSAAVDVVLATPEQVEQYRDAKCLVIGSALKEGKVVYERATAATQRSPRMAQSSQKQSRPRKSQHSRRLS